MYVVNYYCLLIINSLYIFTYKQNIRVGALLINNTTDRHNIISPLHSQYL